MSLVSQYKISDVSRSDLKQGMADGSIILIDIREPYEFIAGHVPGALSLPLSQFDQTSLPNDTTARVVFMCAAGVRTAKLLEALQDAGFDYCEHYQAGFKDWLASGEEIEF
ncbi:rhodanese-like domain-containing protein [Microvirga sp. W0021]|uniref:Rhodanese-like domain-containing protein n=1 Tax=Hohaiivirga grylli TaxID=3133970 RepID=A0ABV0BKI0_9HYPH